MRVATTGLVLFATATLLSAQQGVSRPYQEGEVQSFLERAREERKRFGTWAKTCAPMFAEPAMAIGHYWGTAEGVAG